MTYGYGDPSGGWPPSEPDPAPRARRHGIDDEAGQRPGGGPPETLGRPAQAPDERGPWGAPPPERSYGAPAARDYGPPGERDYGPPAERGYGPPPTEGRGYGAPPADRDYGPPLTEGRTYGPPPTESRTYGAPPERGYGAPPAQRPGFDDGSAEPRREPGHLSDRYVSRREGPAVTRPGAPDRGRDDPRPAGRAPQAWQDGLVGERERRGYGEPGGQRPGYGADDYPRQGGRARTNQYGIPAPADPRTRPDTYPPRPRSGEEYYGDDRSDDSGRRGRLEPPARQRGPWLSVLAVVATVALLAVCGAGFYVTFLGGKSSPDGQPGPTVHDISNQGIDPAPLTVAEVFPAATITVGAAGASSAAAAPTGSASAGTAGIQPYQVVKAESTDCKNAVVGDLATLLASGGCREVVRATLLTADGQYVVTTGLFNLKDQATAKQINDGVKGIVNATKGRFTGFMAGGATDVIGRAKTQLAWDTRGHFLIYCVIARADSAEPDPKNPSVTQLVTDIVEGYLNETVLTNRTLTPPAVAPSGAVTTAPAK